MTKERVKTMANRTEQNTTQALAAGLTPQQARACVLLASGESYTATAERVGVNRGTLYRWQESVMFQRFYNQQVLDFQSEFKKALLGLHGKAVDTIKDLLCNGSERTKLKVAMWLLERMDSVFVDLQYQWQKDNLQMSDEGACFIE